MIKITVPREKISFIRDIEGRKFEGGFWLFPDSAKTKLINLDLLENDSKEIEVNKERIQFELSKHLRSYQSNISNDALNYGSYGIFADTGTGKGHIGLELTRHYEKTLIVCPLSIIKEAWIKDCLEFFPDRKITSLWGISKKERLEKLKKESDIYIINFDGIDIIYNEILDKKFDCIIVDESSKIKNLKSKITQTLLDLSSHIKHRFVLSGCPTPNHNSEIFSQMKFVNPEILGNNFYGFLAKYFSQDMENPHRWFQTEENKNKFFNKLSEQCVFLKKEDCVDLPDKVFEVRGYNLLKDQKRYYEDLLNDILTNINTWTKFEFTAKLMKLREILSGFLITKENTIIDFESGKESELKDIIEEIGNHSIIIWCQFNHEINRLAKQFKGKALTSDTKDRDSIIDDFSKNKIKLLFCHPKLLGMGLTFTNCSYNIYYSISYSYEEFKQSQDRIHRIGQINKCTYIVLQNENTIDKKIYDCLINKKSAVDELYQNLRLKS